VEETFEAAAKKRIRIATKAGASITLEDGNIFVECPGKLTIWRMQNDFNGPAFVEYGLEDHPENELKHPFIFDIDQSPLGVKSSWTGMPYKVYADGSLHDEGVIDSSGRIMVEHCDTVQEYRLELSNGMQYTVPVVEEYSNLERGKAANLGFHKHVSEAHDDNPLREDFLSLLKGTNRSE
jgi:type VI secretion system secreted protein VgrG